MLKYKLKKIPKKKLIIWTTMILLFFISLGSIVGYYAAGGTAFDGGASIIEGDTVIVNDLLDDWNYYMGLNYTEITNKDVLPGINDANNKAESSGKYSQSTLVAVQINYDGTDINEDITGYVSYLSTEQQNKFTYYKYVPIVDGQVKIELIDNPFTQRPTNKGFNGWVCDDEKTGGVDCNSLIFSYDNDNYTRYVTVAAPSANEEGDKKLVVNLRASWADARVTSNVNDITNIFKPKEMIEVGSPITEETPIYEVLLSFKNGVTYYEYELVSRNGSLSHCENTQWWEEQCNNRRGCECYFETDDSSYQNKTYYVYSWNTGFVEAEDDDFNQVQTDNIIGYEEIVVGYEANFENGTSLVGYYYLTTYDSSNSHLYYNKSGVQCSVSGANCSGEVYKLIQYNDDASIKTWTIELVEQEDGSTIENVLNDPDRYFYFSTRDMNIFDLSGSNASFSATDFDGYSYPMTVTGNHDGDYSGESISSSAISLTEDLVFENLSFTGLTLSTNATSNAFGTENVALANYKNFKIARTVSAPTGNMVFRGVWGGDNSGYSSDKTGKIMIEAGHYNHMMALHNSGATNENVIFQVGNDYERVREYDDNLKVAYQIASSTGGSHDSTLVRPTSLIVIKSGIIGSEIIEHADNEYAGNFGSYYMYGIYVGARASGGSNSIRSIKIEGGQIFCINGGPSVESNYSGNVISIYMTGGTVDNIVGGAGQSTTEGNRLISITGGQVKNSVAGGSNSYITESYNDGLLKGDTLIYIGGDAHIGGTPSISQSQNVSTLMGVSNPGSVFGAGLGNNPDSTQIGVVYNSHIIIDGAAEIDGSVFGGGNYGSTGVGVNSNTFAVVDILGGTVEGSVFGSANMNGAGVNNSGEDYSNSVNQQTGYLAQKYWTRSVGQTITAYSHLADGSYTTYNRTCYTNTPGYQYTSWGRNFCEFFREVAAGTEYDPNVAYYDFDYSINEFYLVENPNVNYPTDDDESGSNVNVVDFYHDITINMSDGTVLGSVYGGSNVSGTSYADVTINLTGGNVNSTSSGVYGGGKGQETILGGRTVINTNPSANSDLIVNEIYGGSELGQVNRNGYTDINISGGNITTIYGGGKGSAASSLAPTTYGNIDVTIDSGDIVDVFGGNNEFGEVSTSMVVTVNGGEVDSVYGGANGSGASVINTSVTINGGKINDYVYGGGAFAPTSGKTSVTINGGIFATFNADGTVDSENDSYALVFGGGESASVGESNVYIESGANVYSVYGGSNFDGLVNKTSVYANSGTILCNAYGGGSEAETEDSNIYLNGSVFSYQLNSTLGETTYSNSCGNAFGGGALADVDSSRIALNGSTLINVYGGSDQDGIVSSSEVIIKKGIVENVFGGNNQGGDTVTSDVLVDLNAEVLDENSNEVIIAGDAAASGELIVDYVFGGSNGKDATVSGTTLTEIKSGIVTNDVFGGGNLAKVVGGTTVNMYGGEVKHLYGGGNRAFIGDASVTESGDLIEGISHGYTYVNVVGGVIKGNIYGSGNASFVNGNTYLKIGTAAYDTLGITDNNLYTVLSIGGSIFAGSETNTDKSTTYDESYEGVTGKSGYGTGLIEIDGSNYIKDNKSTLTITGSIYGSGNNSKVLNGSTIYIDNLGTETYPLIISTIQRARNVYITDSYLELNGDRDRADPDSYKYSLIRLDSIYLLGSSADKGTHLYLRRSTSFLKAHYSGTMTEDSDGNKVFTPQTVSEVNGVLTPAVSNNKLFMFKRYIYTVASANAPSYDADTSSAGPVTGMTYLGMYSGEINSNVYEKGIYDDSYDQGGTYDSELTGSFETSDYTFVYGLHADDPDMNDEEEAEYQIKNNGFYTHVQGVDTAEDGTETKNNTITVEYVGVTPLDTTYYKWVIGEEPAEIIVNLIADKYSESGTVNALITLDELKEVLEDGTKQEWRDAVLTIKSVETDSFGAVKGTDSTENIKGYLVDKSKVPTINTNDGDDIVDPDGIIDSNQYFALSMGTTSSGWLDNYKTNFYDEEFVIGDDFCDGDAPGGCTGDQIYLYDSTTKQRSLSFWLYHSKNLDFQYILQEEDSTDVNMLLPMGHVVINAEVYNPHGDQTSTESTQSVIITVNISLSDGELDKYGGIIAPGKQYEVFQGKATTIATDGAFSIYQSLSLDLQGTIAGSAINEPWSVKKLYNRENDSVTVVDAYGVEKVVSWSESYRYLNSDIVFPVGTVITMLDLKNNEQYYYEVTAENRAAMIQEYSGTNNEYKYMLEDFVRMGSTSTTNLYDDDMNEEQSTKYYYRQENDDGKVISEMAVEEFIFTVDFSGVDEANTSVLKGQHYLFLELGRKESGMNKVVVSTNGMPKDEMIYSVVSDVNSVVSTTGGYVQEDGTVTPSTSIYVGESAELELDTKLLQTDSTGKELSGVSDTTFDEYKLGAKITIQRAKLDEDGNVVIEDGKVVYEPLTADLFGTVMTINGKKYYPQTDGSTRIELAGRITDVTSSIDIDFSNSSLGYGEYLLVVETFVSYDGLYYGDFEATYNEFPFTMLNNQYGLDVSTEPVQITHDVNTGEDQNGSREIKYTLKSVNGVENPILRISLQRREYNVISPYGTTYKNVDLSYLADGLKFGDTEISLDNSCYLSDTNGVCYSYTLGEVSNSGDLLEYYISLTLKDGPDTNDLSNKNDAKWKSGTYRVVFTLYDGDTEVGSVYEYLVIRSLDIDEIIIEGSGN